MTFVNLLTEKTREHPLFTVTVDMEVIHTFLEEMCLKLDNIGNRLTKAEEDITGKATFQDVKDFKQDVSDKVDQIVLQCKQTDDKVNTMDALLQDKFNEMSEKFEAATSNCLVESGNLVRSQIESLQPELVKDVIVAMPNMESLLEKIDANTKLINEHNLKFESIDEQAKLFSNADTNLQAQIDALFSTVNKEGEEKTLLKMPSFTRVASNMSFQKSPKLATSNSEEAFDYADDLQKQINQLSEKLKKMEEEIEDGRNYTNKQINTVQELFSPSIRDINNQIDQLKTDMSSRTTTSSSRQVDLPPDLMDKINSLGSDLSSMNNDMIELRGRVDDTVAAVKSLAESFTSGPAASVEPIEIKEDGSVDISGLSNSIQFLLNTAKVLASRLDVLEEKKYVTPDALTATRDIANKCVDRLNALDQKIPEMQNEIFVKFNEDLLNTREELSRDIRDARDAANGSREVATIASRNGDETLRLLQKTRTEMSELGTRVAELAIPKPNPAVEKLTANFTALNQDVAALKDILTACVKDVTENGKLSRSNEAAIASVLTRIDELAKDLSEKEKEFVAPKIDLVQPRKVIVRSQAPEPAPISDESPRRAGSVALPKINDAKIDATLGKVNAQDGIIHGMRKQIDQLVKGYQQMDDAKADKQAVQSLFEQFRVAMVELNSRILTIKRSVIAKADLSEVKSMLSMATTIQNKDTAGGVEPVRCICCGRPATGVTGSLAESLDGRKTPPISSRAISDAEGQVCFVYGDRGDMFYGRSGDGRSRFSARTDTTAATDRASSIRK